MFVWGLFSWVFLSRLVLTMCHNRTTLDLIDNCPNSYRILEPKTETNNGKEVCWDLAKRREVPGSTALSHLCPGLNIGFLENDTVVNITWKTEINDSLYPSQYLMELTRHKKSGDLYKVSRTCILLQIRNRAFKQSKAKTIIFDCVKVGVEKDLYLSAQVWRVLTSQDIDTVDAGTTAQTECTEDNNIPLSLGFYIPRICHCSDLPKLSLDRLTNGSLQIEVWNLPQFAYKIDVYIYESGRYDAVFYKQLPGTSFVNESRFVTTERQYGLGNYTLVVDAACPGNYEDLLQSGVTCPLMDPVQLEYTLEVPLPLESQPAVIRHSNYFVVLTCAVLTVLICIGTVYAWLRIRRRRQKSHAEQNCEEKEQMEVTPLNNVTESNRHPNLGEPKPDILLVYYPDNDEHTNKVNKLRDILQDCYGVNVVFSLSEPSKEFSQSASPEYTDIIMVISEGLYDICKNYRLKSSRGVTPVSDVDNNAINRILEILDTVHRVKMVEYGFAVHFVSFELDSILAEKFKENIELPKSEVNKYIHELHIDEGVGGDNENTSVIALKELVQSLTGFASEVRNSGRICLEWGETKQMAIFK